MAAAMADLFEGKGRLRFPAGQLGCARWSAACLPGGGPGKVEACTPFRTGEEAKAVRKWKVTRGSRSRLSLFTLEVFLSLRRLTDRAGLELIQRRRVRSRHARAGVNKFARPLRQLRQRQQAQPFTY